MKKVVFFACLPLYMAGIFASPVIAQTSTPDEARQALEAAYTQMDGAVAAKDPSGILTWLAPDFKEVERDGKVLDNQKNKIAEIGELEIAQSIQTKTSVQNVQIQSDGMALATVKVHTTIVFVDEKTDILDHGSYDETDRDLWQKTDQGWREKISHTVTRTVQVQKQTLAVPVSPKVKQDVKDAIQDVCAASDAAIVRGDIETATDFYENPALKLEAQDDLSQTLPQLQDITSTTSIQSIKITNKPATQAVLVTQRRLVATFEVAEINQPQTHEDILTMRELWNKDSTGWHIVGGHLLKHALLVNGLPVHIAGYTVP